MVRRCPTRSLSQGERAGVRASCPSFATMKRCAQEFRDHHLRLSSFAPCFRRANQEYRQRHLHFKARQFNHDDCGFATPTEGRPTRLIQTAHLQRTLNEGKAAIQFLHRTGAPAGIARCGDNPLLAPRFSRFNQSHHIQTQSQPMNKTNPIARILVVLFAALALHLTPARAADFYWTNTLGGYWGVAVNWSPNQVPGTNDSAFVNVHGLKQSGDGGGSRDGAGRPWRCATHALVT